MRALQIAVAVLLAAAAFTGAAAADLAGKWTTGERVSFFVVHDAAWDEEVQANGGRAFRNTAAGTLTDGTLTISGAREHTGERAYRAELKLVP